MPAFSLGTVWEETIAFMRRENALLLPLALALFGPAQIMLEYGMTAAMAARAGGSAGTAGTAAPLVMLLIIPGAILALFGSIATSLVALVPGISVGEALSRGLGRLPMTIGATLLLGLGMAGAGLLVIIVMVMGSMALRVDPRAAASPIGTLVVVPMMIVMIRMLLIVPVAATEGIGPVETLRRTWALGSGNVLRLIGVWLLIMFLGFVVALLQQFVVGTLILLLRQATGAADLLAVIQLLINAGMEAMLSAGLAVYVAFVYRALAGPAARS